MNNIFQKNIVALNKKNKNLADRLLTWIPSDLPKLVQENGVYNFLYKDKYIHNRQNPLGEAEEIFSMATNEPVAIHLVYGIGLGYLFQTVSAKSNGTVILYENDLNVIWTAFTLVDFSEDIMKKNVFIVDNYDDAVREIYKKSNTLNTPQLLSLPSVREFDKEGFDKLVNDLQNIVGSFGLDLKYTKERFYPALKMLIENIPALLKEPPLAKYKGSYTGKTAVIVSAGPTLDRNLETLKKYRDNYILFTVGTAAKTLYKNGVKPDFICIIETYNSSRQIEGLDLEDINFITEPYSNNALRNFKFKKIYSHISANAPINHFWADLCKENIEEYWAKGTVSYMAMNCARILGCSKIILVGQDLAYVEGQCYSKDSAYKDLICQYNKGLEQWEIVPKDFESFANAISASDNYEERKAVAVSRLNRLNNSLYHVKGIQGDMIPTESVYAAFINPISEFAEHFTGIEYINTSLVGAQIDGFENMPLESALKDSQKVGNIELNGDYAYDTESLKSQIDKEVKRLDECLSVVDEAKKVAKNLKNDLMRRKSVDQDILKNLKKLSTYYLNLSGELAEKSKLFDFVTVSDKIDIDYEMRMIKELNFGNVSRICEKLTMYLNNSKIRAGEIKSMLEKVCNESLNTKS